MLSSATLSATMSTEMDFTSGSRRVRLHHDPAFHVVVAYDTPESARLAMRLVDGIAVEFAKAFDVQRDVWRFNVLGLPEARDAAADTSARADLLIVSAAAADLPAPVKTWLECWSAERVPGTAAVVALLRMPPAINPGPSPAHRFLQSLAQQAGQDFFASELITPDGSAGSQVGHIHPLWDDGDVLVPSFGRPAMQIPQPRHWGIND
jgi:hypothetical protein